jgi:hypothetical protein
MILKGEYTLTVGGKERHFKLGTLSDNIFCQLENIKLSEYRNRLLNAQAFTQLNFVYSQALAYCRINKIEVDFTVEDVSVWIDEVGENAFSEKMVELSQEYAEKNLKAPETGQSGNGQTG